VLAISIAYFSPFTAIICCCTGARELLCISVASIACALCRVRACSAKCVRFGTLIAISLSGCEPSRSPVRFVRAPTYNSARHTRNRCSQIPTYISRALCGDAFCRDLRTIPSRFCVLPQTITLGSVVLPSCNPLEQRAQRTQFIYYIQAKSIKILFDC